MNKKVFYITIKEISGTEVLDKAGRKWSLQMFSKFGAIGIGDTFKALNKHWPRTGKKKGLNIVTILNKVAHKHCHRRDVFIIFFIPKNELSKDVFFEIIKPELFGEFEVMKESDFKKFPITHKDMIIDWPADINDFTLAKVLHTHRSHSNNVVVLTDVGFNESSADCLADHVFII